MVALNINLELRWTTISLPKLSHLLKLLGLLLLAGLDLTPYSSSPGPSSLVEFTYEDVFTAHGVILALPLLQLPTSSSRLNMRGDHTVLA